jgi:excisionase family DNA binding protein
MRHYASRITHYALRITHYMSLLRRGGNGMEDPSKEKKWLSLGEASKLLGIHPVTLRIWADTGKMPYTRTPGGHRRFAEEDVLAFYESSQDRADANDLDLLVQSALGRTRWELNRHGLAGQGWYPAFDQMGRFHEQELGRRLLSVLVQYVARSAEKKSLDEGRVLGGRMGTATAQVGLSLAETVRAYLLFQGSVIDAVVPALSRPGRIDERDLQLYARAKSFMQEVLFALLDAYQAAARGAGG